MCLKKMTDTIIDLIRHGEPEGGSHIIRGRTDHPLTEKGWQQMQQTIGTHKPWDKLISSPAQRCYAFAEQLSSSLELPLESNEHLWELDLGSWDGKTLNEIQAMDADRLQKYWQDPVNNTPPGAESLPDFRSRILQAWESILQQHIGDHLLVIAHSGTIRMIIGHVLDMPMTSLLRMELPYAGLSRIKVYSEENKVLSCSLVFHNGQLHD